MLIHMLRAGFIIVTTFFIQMTLAVEPLAVNYDQSFIKFSGVQNKDNEFSGQFKQFEPLIVFDREDLASSSIKVEVDLTSVESGSEKRDGMLQKKNWFDVSNTPKGYFVSDTIEKGNEKDQYKVVGRLTIKGIEKPVTLFINIVELGRLIELTGSYTLNRLDFNLGLGAWKNPDWVKHEVEVNYKVVLKQ